MPNLNNQVSGSAIAFIDTQVENYQSLIAGVTPGTEVVVLDGNRDAMTKLLIFYAIVPILTAFTSFLTVLRAACNSATFA